MARARLTFADKVHWNFGLAFGLAANAQGVPTHNGWDIHV